ncbi:unnamed protein product [Adineta steineri]|uniref:Uncharacterized protein n=1 Tax=Adineta steineri TaxID=433720 RepID=A0A815TWT4_9BILA|nr:unnamed protein product [Adineta steineri]CAF4195856.1 unnamed protein product [Adineta steineri]
MGSAECKPSAQQRGDAAHIRQYDENLNQHKDNVETRRTCNEIIHGKEMEHEPKYDPFLTEQKDKRGL